MPVIQFNLVCPDIAAKETKALGVTNDKEIPDGAYQFEEMFCDNPQCDCREAIIVVYEQKLGSVPLATIRYDLKAAELLRDASGLCPTCRSGAELLPDGDQTEIAEPLLDLFVECLAKNNYAQTLARHYKMFKASVAGKQMDTVSRRIVGHTKKRR